MLLKRPLGTIRKKSKVMRLNTLITNITIT